MADPRKSSPLDPELDARLVQRCLAGDPRAWDQLVSRHERLVLSVARSWRLSDEDMADVFQDVFAALVKGLPRLRDARTLVRWLSSTTDRMARTTALRRRREQSLRSDDPDALDRHAADEAPIGAGLEQLERQAVVRLAFAGLPERCRRLLAALYYEDPAPAYADLARRLGLPVGSLGPTRARCMARLRELLASLEGGITEAPAGTSHTVIGRRPRAPRRTAGPLDPESPAENSP
jgi:RNA polymerase sigma factor (sigma-70 family)